VVEEFLEEELVALENDDFDEREEIIFTGDRTRIKTGIFYPVLIMVFRSNKGRSKSEKKKKREKDKSLPKP
jgi:hypothetical protein